MYLVTTPLPRGALSAAFGRLQTSLKRLAQHLPAAPAAELERQLGNAQSANELDAIERRWARAHSRRFG